MQTVKDIVQSLVDDGLVDTDKVGANVFYLGVSKQGLAAGFATSFYLPSSLSILLTFFEKISASFHRESERLMT